MKTLYLSPERYDRIKRAHPNWTPKAGVRVVVVRKRIWQFPFFAAMAIIIFVHTLFAVLVLGHKKP